MTTAPSVTSTSAIEVRVSVCLRTRSTIVLVAAKSEFSFIKLDAVVGEEHIRGDLTHCVVLEHFWLIESEATFEENFLRWKGKESRGEQKSRSLKVRFVLVN